MVYAPQGQSGNFFNRQERNVRSLQFVEALTFSKDTGPAHHLFKVGVDLQHSQLRRRQLQPAARRAAPRRIAGRADHVLAAADAPGRQRHRVRACSRRIAGASTIALDVRAGLPHRTATTSSRRVNYSPRVGHVGQPAARGPRDSARRLRQIRGTHAADRRRVHAVRSRRRSPGSPPTASRSARRSPSRTSSMAR